MYFQTCTLIVHILVVVSQSLLLSFSRPSTETVPRRGVYWWGLQPSCQSGRRRSTKRWHNPSYREWGLISCSCVYSCTSNLLLADMFCTLVCNNFTSILYGVYSDMSSPPFMGQYWKQNVNRSNLYFLWYSCCCTAIIIIVLVQAMGWSDGQGLGRSNQGIVEPIKVRFSVCIIIQFYCALHSTVQLIHMWQKTHTPIFGWDLLYVWPSYYVWYDINYAVG